MQKTKNEISAYLNNILLLLLGIFLLAFPLVFSTLTTDPYLLPKQLLLGAIALVALVLLGARMISNGKVVLRRTPVNLPVLLFTAVAFISTLLSLNRASALIVFAPLLFAIILYFVIINTIRNASALVFLLSSLLLGALLLAVLHILSFFKIYILPFAITKSQTFTTTGFLLDQMLYFVILLPIALYYMIPLIRYFAAKREGASTKSKLPAGIFFGGSAVVIAVALGITVFQLIRVQKPLLLPYGVGFQTAFAAISQDASRTAQGFFFGSGIGTYNTDFTRFKQQSFNNYQDLWSLTFFRSSSYLLELLATTGILGLLSFIFILFQAIKGTGLYLLKKNMIFVPFMIAAIAALLLPFGFITQTLFFVILALMLAAEGIKQHQKYYDLEFNFVALKKGGINVLPMQWNPNGTISSTTQETSYAKFMPISFFLICLGVAGYLVYQLIMYVSSDVIFQNSLTAAAANNGLQTYNDQTNAIRMYPARDVYYRVYSQTNLALANSIASNQPKDSSPSAQVQQTISTLIQQSINSARSASSLSPLTGLNWQNLSSIYRSLIGFGQNAERFALLANQQAITLDPTNPTLYIVQGGIYYQLGAWDDAARQFQIAISLKPDLANAYYNLGHALEQKGDYQNALAQYEAVKTLLANDKENSKRINEEIAALKGKIGSAQQTSESQTQQAPATTTKPTTSKEDLGISSPSAQLPARQQQVEIPAPTISVQPSPTTTPKVTVTPSP